MSFDNTKSKSLFSSWWSWAAVVSLAIGALFWREVRAIQLTPLNSWTDDQSADCAVALTGGAGRIREGMDLLSQKRVRTLIIAGANPSSTLRDMIPGWVFYGNLDFGAVVLEKRSTTTFGNAQQTASLVEAFRCRDVILITSRLHMMRALRTFQRTYPPEVTILPRSVVGTGLSPKWSEVLSEASKSLFYRFWAYD